jgi:hypothetical protein
MTITPTQQITAALADLDISVPPELADQIAAKLGSAGIADGLAQGPLRLGWMARAALEGIVADTAAAAAAQKPAPLTTDQRIVAFYSSKGIDLKSLPAERRLALYSHALLVIEKMENGTPTEESKALATIAAKGDRANLTDLMHLANARQTDATGNKPVVGVRPVSDPNAAAARLPASERLRQANLLNSPMLSKLVREANNVAARLVKMPAGVERAATETYLDGLRRQAKIHGVIV